VLASNINCAKLNSFRQVLVFLEQLKSEGASSARSRLELEDEFETYINGDGQEDMASDVQEGAQSTVGSLVQRNGVRPLSSRLVLSADRLHSTLHQYTSVSPGRTMSLVPTTSRTDRHLVISVPCLRTALSARYVWHCVSFSVIDKLNDVV
jgi:hypothetical protein